MGKPSSSILSFNEELQQLKQDVAAIPKIMLQSGEWGADGVELTENKGMRKIERFIEFDHPFKSPPKVICGLTGMDARGRDTVTRLKVSVISSRIQKDGFSVEISTWSNSIVYWLSIHWLAYTIE